MEFITNCFNHHKKLCLLTANNYQATINILDKYNLTSKFDEIITCDHTTLDKRSGEAYNYAISALHLHKDECIVIDTFAVKIIKRKGEMIMKKVLTIAGTDPTGGAGVQADLKTMTAHKVYGMSIITALVAQNTLGVRDIMEVKPDFLAEQFDCVFEDIYPDAIKIGMGSSPVLIEMIVNKLTSQKDCPIVVDPVMVSTSGSRLLADNALRLLKEKLIPLATIITPNIPEAQVLTNLKINTKDDMITAAKMISEWYHGYILIKGGHFEERADDLLYYRGNITWLTGEKINNPNTHGTGCTLSSAIASNLALEYSIEESVTRAKVYITGALKANLNLGHGSGPLDHCWNINQTLK